MHKYSLQQGRPSRPFWTRTLGLRFPCFNDNPTKVTNVLYHKLIASSKVVLSCEPCWPFVGPSDYRISSVHSPTSRFSLVQLEEFSPAISPDAINTLNVVTILGMNTRCLVHAELCFEWCGSTWSFSHVSTIDKVHTNFLCVFVTISHCQHNLKNIR